MVSVFETSALLEDTVEMRKPWFFKAEPKLKWAVSFFGGGGGEGRNPKIDFWSQIIWILHHSKNARCERDSLVVTT